MKIKRLCAILVASVCVQATAHAEFPDHTIRLVSPYSPGSTVDILARALAVSLSKELSQSVIVENKSGAGGNIGLDFVAKAPKDGYIIGLGSTGPLTINPWLFKRMPFNAQKDLAPVSIIGSGPNVLFVNPQVPAKSVQDLVAYAKSNPNKLNFASSGIGSTNHLAGELFKSVAQIDITHVPYKGNQDALSDVLAGRVDILFSGLPPVVGMVQAEKLIPLAVAGPRRIASLPNVPTLAEAGLPGADVIAWYGVVAPAGTPVEVLDRLHDAIAKAMANPNTREQFERAGTDPTASSRAEFTSTIDSETQKWGRVVKAAGVQAN